MISTLDNSTFGSLKGEWTIFSSARARYQVPEGYYDLYYSNVVKEVKTQIVQLISIMVLSTTVLGIVISNITKKNKKKKNE